MKKKLWIPVLVCTIIFLSICGVLGFQYQDLNGRYQKLEIEASQLQENNSGLNEKLEDSAAKLEEKEKYIEGQKDYISELSEQIQDFGKEDSDEDSSQDSWYSPNKYEDDPYPNLYADKDDLPVQSGQKYVYLTFDDGPSSLTPKVLDLLDQYNAHATFFVVTTNNEEYAEYLSEIVKRGHTLGLHSYSHNYNQIYRSVDAFLEDYEKVYDWVYEETDGYSPCLFRFPGGSNNGSSYVVNNIITEMERRGFTHYDWNVSSGDGSNLTTTENIIDNICTNVGYVDNPVILMHDGSGKDATLAALPTVLQKLSDAGYEFRSLDQHSEPVQYRQSK